MKRKGLYVIGLTGNIATGKSVVARMLGELGAWVLDADTLAHQAMRAGTPTLQLVVDEFGAGILSQDGEIDRARLGARVFEDPLALSRLEAIVHPSVIATAELLLQGFQAGLAAEEPASLKVVVLEAIKLFESGMSRRCDEVWVVTCPREIQLQRLMEARSLSRAEAEVRIAAQPPQEEKTARARVVIDNSGDLERTREQVAREWHRISQRRSRGRKRHTKNQACP